MTKQLHEFCCIGFSTWGVGNPKKSNFAKEYKFLVFHFLMPTVTDHESVEMIFVLICLTSLLILTLRFVLRDFLLHW